MAIGYIANAAAFTAIVFGISPYLTDKPARSLVSCYDHIIEACSHAENPFCAFERLEICDRHLTETKRISAGMSEHVRSRQSLASDLIEANHATVTTDQRTVRHISLDEIWRSQGG